MSDIIHKLGTPAGIVTFEGEVIDVNDWLLSDSRADSKLQILNYSIFDLNVDNTRHNEVIDYLIEKKVIQNQKALVRTFDGNIVERIFNATLLSEERRLILYQNYGSFDTQLSTVDYSGRLLKDFKKLYPYLNKVGKEVFNQVIEVHKSIINKSTQQAQIESISKKIDLSFSKLTQSEKYFSSMIAMGFSPKEIEHVSGFSPVTIRVNIHRICEKYDIDNRDELFCMLKQTVTSAE